MEDWEYYCIEWIQSINECKDLKNSRPKYFDRWIEIYYSRIFDLALGGI